MATTNITTKTVLTPVSTNEVLGVKDGVLGRFEIAALPVSTATQAALDLKANSASPTFTGVVTETNAVKVIAATEIAAFAIDITKPLNTKSVSTDATFTFDGTPVAGQRTALKVTNNATSRLITLPSFWCRNRNELITEVIMFANQVRTIEFDYTGARWESSSYPMDGFNPANNAFNFARNIGSNFTGVGVVRIGGSIGTGTVNGVGSAAKMTNFNDSVFIGIGAGEMGTIGNGVVAIGRNALQDATENYSNTALGDSALTDTTGDHNTGVGYQGGAGNVTGEWNTFVGAYCGGVTRDKGDYNICVGPYAGDGLIGDDNIFIGRTSGPGEALGSSTCNYNIGVGFQTLSAITTGDSNVAVGESSGLATSTGSNNVFVGYRAGSDGQLATASNSICIGANTQATASNQMVLGHTDITQTLIRGSTVKLGAAFTPTVASVLTVGDTNGLGISLCGTSTFNLMHFEKTDATSTVKTWAVGNYDGVGYGASGNNFIIRGNHTDGLPRTALMINPNGDVLLAASAYGVNGKVGVGNLAPAEMLDVTGNVAVSGVVKLTAPTTTRATLNIPHGTAPTSPVNGDMWTTSAGLFVRINGTTVGPLS